MPARWLLTVLSRIRALAVQRKVRFTYKAFRELAALDLGLDEDDACDILANLSTSDCVERLVSRETGEWMYLFTPRVAWSVLYVKVILRADCVVISFREGKDEDDEDE